GPMPDRAPRRCRRRGRARSGARRATITVAIAAGVLGCMETAAPGGAGGPVEVVDTVAVVLRLDSGQAPISPYIYGSNQDHPGSVWTVRRWGGNRTTGYNWENNASNAGADWDHSSDLYLVTNAGLPESAAETPGSVIRHHHQASLAMGAESIITIPMAGYVAADAGGPVSETETAPSDRWVPVDYAKSEPLTTDPDLEDGRVFADEMVHLLVQSFGGAASGDGVRWYSLDNEPALWAHTHPRLHPDPVNATELVDRTVALASAIKEVDPGAGVLGPVLYGMTAFVSLQEAPDWTRIGAGYDWFIDYYLDALREAGAATGRRLVDALDVHWYPEARGDHPITDPAATTPADVAARLQAPRTLWDPTYTEDSWIGEWLGEFLPILPVLRRAIDEHYPGTALAVTEYDYGGGATVSGGLAQADVLGAFGRYGVDIATAWGMGPEDDYRAAGFRLYRDYDDQGGRFGDTSVPAGTSDPETLSVWAAVNSNGSTLHIVLINKRPDGAVAVELELDGGGSYTTGGVWGFGPGSPAITARDPVTDLTDSSASYVVPAHSAVHLVLR
ncbi:MAG: glycoside hydrolase family 44 protein, partial [Gemmatimonadota bacterium]